MSDVEENNFEGRVNVREEMEEHHAPSQNLQLGVLLVQNLRAGQDLIAHQELLNILNHTLDQDQNPDLDPEDILIGDTLALDPILTGGDHAVNHIPQNIGVEGAEATLLCLTEEGTLAAEYVANPDPNTCLGVFGLSLYTTERDLREVFSRYGPLSGVNVVYDQRTGRSRGFAFVYFERIDDSKEAMEHANGMELDGRRIRVDYSITKRAHTPTPGIYMGRPTQ
ncbi:hypothetical protein E2320_001869 [Naja naja]|nr:hypothetical protein E2320_001869 [Naja naja]